MKLNKCFITCYLLVIKTLYHPHTFINLSPHLYFPFPTESRPSKSATSRGCAFFVWQRTVKSSLLEGAMLHEKSRPAHAGRTFASVDDGPRRSGMWRRRRQIPAEPNHTKQPLRHLRGLFFTTWTTFGQHL